MAAKATGEEGLGSKLRATSLLRTTRDQPSTSHTLVILARVPGGQNGRQLIHRQHLSPIPYGLSWRSSHSQSGPHRQPMLGTQKEERLSSLSQLTAPTPISA